MPGRRRTPAQAERVKQIVDLRRQRVPVAEIAAQLGITSGRVSQLYSQAIRDIPAQSVQEHRAEETALADDAVRALMVIAADSSVTPRTRVEAWTAVRGWAEHKARILGLNAPVKVEVSDEVDAEIGRLAAALAAGVGDLEPAGEAEAAGDAPAGQGSPHTS